VHVAWERLLPADHPDLLRVKQALATTREALGDGAGARELFEHVHAARVRLLPADHPDLLAAKQNLAALRHELGDDAGARELFEDVHDARERLLPADHPDLLAAKQNLAASRRTLGDLEGARQLEEYVLAVWERNLPEDHSNRLLAKTNLAATRYRMGDIAGARELFEDVHAASERLLPPEHPSLLLAKQNLAAVRKASGDLAGARAFEEYVLAARQRLLPPDHPDLLTARANLAATCEASGDRPGLRAAARALLEAQVLVAGGLDMQSPRVARSTAVRELGRLQHVLSWSQTLVAGGEEALDDLLFAALESLREASTAQASAARAASSDAELGESLAALNRVRRDLAEMSQVGPASAAGVETWRSALFELAEERDRLQRDVRKALVASGVVTEMPSAALVASGLAPNAALVSFFKYTRHFETDSATGNAPAAIDSLLAFVVAPDASVRRIELGAIADIQESVEAWRAACGSPLGARDRGLGIAESAAEGDLVRTGESVRRLVLDPIFATAPRATTLHLVLDDALFLVPLDALPLGDGIVGEQFTIRVGTTVRQFDASDDEGDAIVEPHLLVVGGVDYAASGADADEREVFTATPPLDGTTRSVAGANFALLLGAGLEARRVAEQFETWIGVEADLVTGAAATKAALVERVEKARYLHVATHGWFAPPTEVSMLDDVGADDGSGAGDALRLSLERTQETIVGFLPETLCGLALAGANHGPEGILTAEELATLDLAVLSACETNVGIRRAGQGIQSLQTALHAAGARTAITSLWKVDDAATMRLFEIFYTKLWSEIMSPADALWQAKMALRSEGHPTRDWAGWVLTGEPG
jgi:CHAT domain-containing protein/tetratricopeptide (TPR) repeat protein